MARPPARAGELEGDVLEVEVADEPRELFGRGSDPIKGPEDLAARIAQLPLPPVEVRTFLGWTALRVLRPLDALSGAFRLEVPPEVGPRGFKVTPFPIRPGNRVTIRLRNLEAIRAWESRSSTFESYLSARERRSREALERDTLMTGYVDSIEASLEPESGRTITITGRDRTADLVDCSIESATHEWTNVRPRDLVQELADPYVVDVQVADDEVSTERAERVLEKFRRQPGESPYAAIERIARMRKLLAYTKGTGELLLTAPGSERSTRSEVDLWERSDSFRPKIHGEGNVLRARMSYDVSKRFRLVTVRGQKRGTDTDSAESVAHVVASSSDPEILRPRALVVIPEGGITFTDAADRARWETTIRAARSATLEVVVQGWRKDPRSTGAWSPPWTVNEIVRTRIPSLQIDSDFLVNGVEYMRDNAGTKTRLALVRPDAYEAEPQVAQEENPFDRFLNEEAVDE